MFYTFCKNIDDLQIKLLTAWSAYFFFSMPDHQGLICCLRVLYCNVTSIFFSKYEYNTSGREALADNMIKFRLAILLVFSRFHNLSACRKQPFKFLYSFALYIRQLLYLL